MLRNGDIYLVHHWSRYWFVAWRHYALTWIIVDFSSKVFYGIHLRLLSQEFSQKFTMDVFRYTCSQIIFMKLSSSPSYLHPDFFPGRKRLKRMPNLHNITFYPAVTCRYAFLMLVSSVGGWECQWGMLARRSLNFLWSNDAIWRHRSGSTFAQVMACSLTAPGHYLNQRWFIIHQMAISQQAHEITSYRRSSKLLRLRMKLHTQGTNEVMPIFTIIPNLCFSVMAAVNLHQFYGYFCWIVCILGYRRAFAIGALWPRIMAVRDFLKMIFFLEQRSCFFLFICLFTRISHNVNLTEYGEWG